MTQRADITAVDQPHRLSRPFFTSGDIKQQNLAAFHILQLHPRLRKGAVGFQVDGSPGALHPEFTVKRRRKTDADVFVHKDHPLLPHLQGDLQRNTLPFHQLICAGRT